MMTPIVARPRHAPDGGDSLMSSTFQLETRSPAGESSPPEDARRLGDMRRQVRKHLDAHGLSHIADDAVLVVSELAANAIVHSGGGEVTITLTRRNSALRIAVGDNAPSHHRMPQVAPGHDDEHGRGLFVVASIAADRRGRCGVENDGATTWCELPVATC